MGSFGRITRWTVQYDMRKLCFKKLRKGYAHTAAGTTHQHMILRPRYEAAATSRMRCSRFRELRQGLSNPNRYEWGKFARLAATHIRRSCRQRRAPFLSHNRRQSFVQPPVRVWNFALLRLHIQCPICAEIGQTAIYLHAWKSRNGWCRILWFLMIL